MAEIRDVIMFWGFPEKKVQCYCCQVSFPGFVFCHHVIFAKVYCNAKIGNLYKDSSSSEGMKESTVEPPMCLGRNGSEHS